MTPEWSRSCADCLKFAYDESGKVSRRAGLPVLRPPGTPTPCDKCPKIPADAPTRSREHAIELSDRNIQAYGHYLECRAIGQFPDDPIVRRNARIIRAVCDEQERLPMARIAAALATLSGIACRS